MQREVVADDEIVGRRFVRRDNLGADLQTFGSQDVFLDPVAINHQGEVGRAIRIVLQRFNGRGLIEDVPFEIDDTIELLVTTANVTGGYTAVDVATAGFGFRFGE